ncbi:hypothetical protein R1sor_006964 [Riccia sorocarpa]|uniref:Uncharacterized protein n=1 Tax=Riccia sorocarpa TaxID=122646 RepID=A0ABD3HPK9_9MARC
MTANKILRNAREREGSVLGRSFRRSTRERDAARKREDYWKEKVFRSSRGLRCELGVSRTARTARGVASELVELFSKKTARFDISTKRVVCEKFWSHPRLNDYHPTSTGSAKLDRYVAQSFLGLKEALKKIKGAQRNDHRNTKHNSLVALAGNAVVQGRYQTTLAKALGIKRTNVYRAAKTRALLDSDDATKFPTGQRRERSDKISAEVRAVVEAFWVAKSRVSPWMKDRVRRCISKGVYETNSAYWLEDREVEVYLAFTEEQERLNSGIKIGLCVTLDCFLQDGLGGMNKNALEREQRKGIRGHKLENAADAVQLLTSKFELDRELAYGHHQNARRFFWEVKVGEVDRSKELDCLPIKGTRSLHCFHGYSPTNPTLLRIKELSCFYPYCVDDEGLRCLNQDYTGKWKLESIHPIKPQDVIAYAEEIGSGVSQGVDWGEGSVADLIETGDFFAVEAEVPNEFNADFWILQCTKPMYQLSKDHTDAYGCTFYAGDFALKGKWYQQWGRRSTCYVRYDSSPLSVVRALDVIHIKFALQPTGVVGGSPSFTLKADTLAEITNSLRRCG